MARIITIETAKLPKHIADFIDSKSVDVELLAVGQTVNIGSQQWDSGSRTLYHVAALDYDHMNAVHDPRAWPLNMQPLGDVPLAPRCVIIETGTFCGKPRAPHIFALAQDAAPMLPKPAATLSTRQNRILGAIAQYNSAGRKRFRQDFRVSQATWDATIAELVTLGLATKQGGLTIEGKNVARTNNVDLNPYSACNADACNNY